MPEPSSFEQPGIRAEPDPALGRRSHRPSPAGYAPGVIAETDRCRHGELGSPRRRESLYRGQAQGRRGELAGCGEQALAVDTPCPAPRLSPERKGLETLGRANACPTRTLEIAEDRIDLRGKALRVDPTVRQRARLARIFSLGENAAPVRPSMSEAASRHHIGRCSPVAVAIARGAPPGTRRRHPERILGDTPQTGEPPERVAIDSFTAEELVDPGASATVDFTTLPIVREKRRLSAQWQHRTGRHLPHRAPSELPSKYNS